MPVQSRLAPPTEALRIRPARFTNTSSVYRVRGRKGLRGGRSTRPPALTALLGGEINVVFLQPPGGVDQIKAGKLRALGFAGSSRWAALPGVPTIAESGVPDFKLKGPFEGVLVPARTPKEIVNRIHAEMRKAIAATR